MALFNFRGKPAWESRDPVERAAAVAAATDAALLALLPDLARADESAAVRRAAVRRVVDLPLLGDRARNDADAGVRATAGERYRLLLAGTAAEGRLPEADRERVLRTEDDAEVLAFVASQAPEPALRRLALERHGKPGLLLECCQRDPDPALRLWLMEKIDSVAVLERIAENSRKRDKRLAHAARERAQSLRLAAGEPEALRQRALAIAEALDVVRRERPSDLEARAGALLDEWRTLAPRVDAALVQRVQGYVDALAAALAAPSSREVTVPTPAATQDEPVNAETDLALQPPAALEPAAQIEPPVATNAGPRDPDPELLALALEAEGHAGDIGPEALGLLRRRQQEAWHRQREHLAAEIDARQRFDASVEAARERHAREAEVRQQRSDAARGVLDALEAALGAQQAQEARDRFASLQALKAAGDLPGALARRLGSLQESYDKLTRWQHWSNNKARASLCDEIEALSAAAAHPDAVATRVREAQAEWQRLDASERLDAEAAAKIGIARRFRAVCHRAMAPAREYFEKRSELRQHKRGAIDELLVRAEGDVPGDPRAIGNLRRELTEAMRRLDEIDPRMRAGLGRRLRGALDRLDGLRDSRNAAAEADKRKLLANLRRQLAQAEPAEAMALAKDAQSRLAVMTRAGREAEEAIRVELASLVDPLFAREREQREGELSATREREAAQAAVLAELQALADGDAALLRQADARIANLAQRWRELAPPEPAPSRDARGARDGRDGRDARNPRDGRGSRDRTDSRDSRGRPPRDDRRRDEERRFDTAVERVKQAQKQSLEATRRGESRALLHLAAACAALEGILLVGGNGDDAAATLRQLVAANPPGHAGLRTRIERTLAWSEAAPDASVLQAAHDGALARGLELALRAEALRGVESPAEFREQRRAWQIKRLAERMSGGALPDPARDRQQVLDGWLGTGPLAAADYDALRTRIETGLGDTP